MKAPASEQDFGRKPVLRRVFSTHHETIGKQFFVLGALMLLLGGLLALAMRWQLAWPWTEMPIVGRALFPDTGRVITPAFYTVLFTMHGTIMIFFVIIPLLTGAFGNCLIPAMIGAREMAFPRLNMWSFWVMIPAVACLFAGFFVEGGAASAGWTGYAPLSTVAQAAPGSIHGQTWWLLALTLTGVSSLLGSINYVTTISTMRASGMSMMRLPLTVWGLLTAASLQIVALPVLTAGGLLQLSDRLIHTGFFTPANLVIGGVDPDVIGSTGGSPLLWQHLFWFYSHPAVYVMILPAMGMVSDVLSVHARKPVFGYRPMVWAMTAICVLGFMVWGHHMFVSGMNPAAGTAFMLATFLIALPSSVKTFNWLATLWGARIRLTSAMLFAIGFVALFVVGGLSGLWLAATPVDVYVHDTYVVVAHFHYIVAGGTLLAMFAGTYHWFPRIFGCRLDERLGRAHFVGTFVLTNCVFLMMHQLGLAGLLRRTADPTAIDFHAHLQPINVFITWSAIGLAAWQTLFVANLVLTALRSRRERAERPTNPWEAGSLEWSAGPAWPAGRGGLVVCRGPYEYADPDAPLELPAAAGRNAARRSGRRGHRRAASLILSALEMSADPADSADSADSIRSVRSSWPRRVARATAILTFPLILLGGLVTTLRVGMAVPDWPTTFGHNMFTYPLPQMLANGGVLWEHSHRLFGSLVGMAAIALVIVHLRFEKRTSMRVLAVAVLLAVIVQGIIGGVRVLQISDEWAFVHGSLAQAVFALIGAVAVMQSDAWVAARSQTSARAVQLRRVALATIAVVYAQIVVGAWLRHTGNMNALGIHIVLAALAVGAVVALVRELKRATDDLAEREPARAAERGPLLVLRKRLQLVLWTQIVLGLLAAAWVFVVTGPHNPVSIGEAVFATLHVGVGAVLLLLCVSAALWSRKLVSSGNVAQGARDMGAPGAAHAGGAR